MMVLNQRLIEQFGGRFFLPNTFVSNTGAIWPSRSDGNGMGSIDMRPEALWGLDVVILVVVGDMQRDAACMGWPAFQDPTASRQASMGGFWDRRESRCRATRASTALVPRATGAGGSCWACTLSGRSPMSGWNDTGMSLAGSEKAGGDAQPPRGSYA